MNLLVNGAQRVSMQLINMPTSSGSRQVGLIIQVNRNDSGAGELRDSLDKAIKSKYGGTAWTGTDNFHELLVPGCEDRIEMIDLLRSKGFQLKERPTC